MSRLATNLFTSGAVVLLLTSAAHTLGHFAERPADPVQQELTEHMKRVTQTMGGMTFSAWQAVECLSLYMSVLAAGLGLVCMVIRPALRACPRVLRPVSGICALVTGGCAAIAFWSHLAPPGAFFALAFALESGAFATGRAGHGAP